MRPYSVATAATGLTLVLGVPTGTTPRRTATATSARAGAVTAVSLRLRSHGSQGRNVSRWSASLPCFGEHTHGSDIVASSETSKTSVGIKMGHKYRNLIGHILSDENMRSAFRQTSKGKRHTKGYLQFKEYSEVNLAKLKTELASGAYRVGEYRHFTVLEPKPRKIMALPVRDRLVQHMLVNVIEPIFERTFLPMSFACRKGCGTHAGMTKAQALVRHMGRDGPVYCLKMDFSGFFHNIDREKLNAIIRRKITCRATLALIEAITPPKGRGLPIGSLTSQLWANVYATEFDRFLLAKGWHNFVRYMDDTVVFGHSMPELHRLKDEAEAFALAELGLRFSKWSVSPVTRGVNFLGYRIWPTYKLLRRQSVVRAKRKIRRFVAKGENEALTRFLASWKGHAAWADSHNLVTSLERGIPT